MSGGAIYLKVIKIALQRFLSGMRKRKGDVKMNWISIKEKKPEPFVSVLGFRTDADQFPSVRECYMVNNGNFFFPALNEFHPVSHWMPMPEFVGEIEDESERVN